MPVTVEQLIEDSAKPDIFLNINEGDLAALNKSREKALLIDKHLMDADSPDALAAGAKAVALGVTSSTKKTDFICVLQRGAILRQKIIQLQQAISPQTILNDLHQDTLNEHYRLLNAITTEQAEAMLNALKGRVTPTEYAAIRKKLLTTQHSFIGELPPLLRLLNHPSYQPGVFMVAIEPIVEKESKGTTWRPSFSFARKKPSTGTHDKAGLLHSENVESDTKALDGSKGKQSRGSKTSGLHFTFSRKPKDSERLLDDGRKDDYYMENPAAGMK